MGDETTNTVPVVPTQQESLENLTRMLRLRPERFYAYAKNKRPEDIEALLNQFPDFGRNKKVAYDMLSSALELVHKHADVQDGELKKAVAINAQRALELVINYVTSERAHERAQGDLVRIAGDTHRRLKEKKDAYDAMFKLAHTDYLTGCFNQRYLQDHVLPKEVKEASKYNRPLSLIFFDIDFFKKINDDCGGHLAGDYVLKDLTKVVRSIMLRPDNDAFVRYAGDEFVFVLPETDETGATAFAEKILTRVKDHKFVYADKTIPVTLSLGVGQYLHGETSTRLFDRADKCMYVAKRLGRKGVANETLVRRLVQDIGDFERVKNMLDLDQSTYIALFSKPEGESLKAPVP